MKKLLILAAAAALLLASCAKVETNNTRAVDENIPIAFSNYAPRSITKAAAANYASGATLVNNAKFKVYAWAYANTATFDATAAPAFMNGVEVTYKEDNTSGANNTYSPQRYWPSGSTPDKLAFFSYYPADDTNIVPSTTNPLGAFTFTAAATAAAQSDFLIADVVPDQVYGHTNASPTYEGTVKFSFKHQLTRVQFKFKKTNVDAAVTVKSAKLYNIKNTGTLTASYGANGTSTAWSAQAGTATYDVAYPTTALTTTASDVAATDIFLLVPQTILANTEAAAQYLEISWDVTAGGVTTTNTQKLYLDDVLDSSNAATNIDWAKNMAVTYTITIGPKPIYFTAEVGAWDAEKDGYFNVQ